MSVTCIIKAATDEQIKELLAHPVKIHEFLNPKPVAGRSARYHFVGLSNGPPVICDDGRYIAAQTQATDFLQELIVF